MVSSKHVKHPIFAAFLLIALLMLYYNSVVIKGNSFIPTIERTYQLGHYHYSGTYWHEAREKASIDPAAAAQINLPSAYLEHLFLKKFQLPLWNPYSGLGRPYHADMNSYTFFLPLYPFKVFPSLFMYDLFLLFRLFIAGFFLFLLLRLYRCSFWISLAGGSFFMFNSYFHAYINMDQLNVTLFLPALLYFLTKFLSSEKKKHLIGFILCSAGSFYGGNPNEFLLIHLFVSAYYVFFLFTEKRREFQKKLNFLLLYGGSLGLSLLLTSLKSLPFLEFWNHSVSSRVGGTVGTDVTLSLKRFLSQMLQPDRMQEGPNYAGYLILSLSFFALFHLIKKRWNLKEKVVAFHGVVLFLGVSKIMGAPYINWIGSLPVLQSIHFVKYSSLLYFSLSVLATFSLTHIGESIQKRKTRGLKGGLFVFSLILPHFLWWVVSQNTLFPSSSNGKILIYIFSLFAVVSLFILLVRKSYRRRGLVSLGVVILAVLSVLELRLNNHQHYRKRFKINDKAPYTQFLLQKKQPYRSIGLDVTFMPNCNLVYPIPTINRMFAMRVKRATAFLSRLISNKFNSGMGHRYSKEEILNNPYMNLANTRYYISESILDSTVINPQFARAHHITSLRNNPSIRYTRRGDLYHYSHWGWEQLADSSINIPLSLPPGDVGLQATGLAFFDQGKRKNPDNRLQLLISVIQEGKKEIIYQRIFRPCRQKDQDFFPLEADLSAYAGKKVILNLKLKNPNPQDRNDRSFFYGNLRIIHHKGKTRNSLQEKEEKPLSYEEVFAHHALVYKNHQAMKRGFLLYKMKEVQNLDQALEIMKENPQMYKKTALVEGRPPTNIQLGKKGISRIEFKDYQPNSMTIDIETSEDGVFVLSDVHYPGWKAFLNGEKVKIYPAFGALRAVFVPQGTHQLRFIYTPWSFIWGAGLTLVTLILLSFIYLKYSRKGRDL